MNSYKFDAMTGGDGSGGPSILPLAGLIAFYLVVAGLI